MLLVNRSLYCNYIPQELVSLYGSQCVTNFCGNLIEGNCFSKVYSEVPLNVKKNILAELPSIQKVKFIQVRVFGSFPILRHLNYLVENFLIVRLLRNDNSIWFYNLERHNLFAFMLLKVIYRKKIYVLLADHTPSNRLFSITKVAEICLSRFVDGILALSERLTIQNKNIVYMPGIVPMNAINSIKETNGEIVKNAFFFSGALKKVTGIKMALDVFSELPECELYVSGRGEDESLVMKYASKYENIHYLGYLNYTDYLSYLKRFTVCLSFRDPNLAENKNNFPSKIIEYLACNKLVVSTIIYPELKDINYVYSNFDKEQLKMCILQLSQMNDAWFEKYSNHRDASLHYFSPMAWSNAFNRVESTNKGL